MMDFDEHKQYVTLKDDPNVQLEDCTVDMTLSFLIVMKSSKRLILRIILVHNLETINTWYVLL